MNTLRRYSTNVKCPKCNRNLTLSIIKDYSFTCLNCEEDFYKMEVRPPEDDLFKLSIKVSKKAYYRKKFEFIKDKFCYDFYDYDDEDKIFIIGFIKIPSIKKLKQLIEYFNLEEMENNITHLVYVEYIEELDLTLVKEDTIEDNEIIKTEIKNFYAGYPDVEDTKYYIDKIFEDYYF